MLTWLTLYESLPFILLLLSNSTSDCILATQGSCFAERVPIFMVEEKETLDTALSKTVFS